MYWIFERDTSRESEDTRTYVITVVEDRIKTTPPKRFLLFEPRETYAGCRVV
jgi:hypothetical protein